MCYSYHLPFHPFHQKAASNAAITTHHHHAALAFCASVYAFCSLFISCLWILLSYLAFWKRKLMHNISTNVDLLLNTYMHCGKQRTTP